MNDAADTPKSRDRLSSFGEARTSAIPDALRHTARVARLRRFIVFTAGGIVGLVLLAIAIQMLRMIPLDLRFAAVGLKGTRITIDSPNLIGYREDGRPYRLHAKLGVQDMTTPDKFELEGIEVRIDDADNRVITLTADRGFYDSKKDHAEMDGSVRIDNSRNLDLRMETAAVDFKAGLMRSDKPAELKMERGEVRAQAAEFSQKDQRATFTGDVRSVFYGEEDEAPAAQAPQMRPSTEK
jgi:lipopolysaccharide export system protein LptC